ncbi:MAG: hypothetical protein OEM41_00170 [Ignavibacteria bacterium]|nr:hypothetical protein [Ignavibacteria bacterium]
MRFRLRDADRTMRVFLTSFIIVVSAGYAVGLLFVDHTTSMTNEGVEQQFLGTPESTAAEELRYAKGPHEMFVFLHNHILSLSLLFFVLGGIFFFSSITPTRWKGFLLIEPFGAIITTFGGIVLVRYVSPSFSWLVIISGLSLPICYAAMVLLILKELWWGSRNT